MDIPVFLVVLLLIMSMFSATLRYAYDTEASSDCCWPFTDVAVRPDDTVLNVDGMITHASQHQHLIQAPDHKDSIMQLWTHMQHITLGIGVFLMHPVITHAAYYSGHSCFSDAPCRHTRCILLWAFVFFWCTLSSHTQHITLGIGVFLVHPVVAVIMLQDIQKVTQNSC